MNKITSAINALLLPAQAIAQRTQLILDTLASIDARLDELNDRLESLTTTTGSIPRKQAVRTLDARERY